MLKIPPSVLMVVCLEVKEAEDEEDGPESSMLNASQEQSDSLDDNGLNLSLFSCQEKV